MTINKGYLYFDGDVAVEKLKKGVTELPDGRKVIYYGDMTVLDKDGKLLAWFDAEFVDLLEERDNEQVV